MTDYTIMGRPVPKARPRMGNGRVYTPAATIAHEEKIGWLYRGAGGKLHEAGTPVHVTLRFCMPDRRRVDIDNLTKTVLDGLNGIAFVDDAQVEMLVAAKVFEAGDARTEVTVVPIN